MYYFKLQKLEFILQKLEFIQLINDMTIDL